MIRSFFQVARRYVSAVRKTPAGRSGLWRVETIPFDWETAGKDGGWFFRTAEAGAGWHIAATEAHT